MLRVGVMVIVAARIARADCEVAVAPPLEVSVTGTRATITVGERTRVIEADSCSELVAAVDVIAAMIRAGIGSDSPPPSGASTVETVIETIRSIPQDVVQADDPESVVSRTTAVTSHVVERDLTLAVGTSNALGEQIAIGMMWRSNASSLATELEGALPGDVNLASVTVERIAIAVAPCHQLNQFEVCGVVRAGFDRGTGTNLMDAKAVYAPRFEIGARLAWEQPVTEHIALQLRTEIDLAATTAQFDVDHLAAWRSSRLAELAGCAFVVRFP